ncbi:MAG: DEAD/DEAH box helicase [Proteobacteria bacterium]|nr:DEAD/DEAH box helicase [Pseudomonadota bacterium]
MIAVQNTLSRFHPLIAKWFNEQIGEPTDVQAQAWPRIARGEHVLITAPTGSGKTLTAFLWAINQLATGKWQTGKTSVLYVSPLKALNNDIRRNLIGPLTALGDVFGQAGEFFPHIKALTRSGDTPQTDRRRMLRHPPEILITTPESLNLLLSSVGGRTILTELSTVILDEIHAVVGEKRGTHLITAVDRLVPLSGEFQRISLSATIKPLETVGEFVGGLAVEGDAKNPRYSPRAISIVRSTVSKQYDIRVCFPKEAVGRDMQESLWHSLVAEFKTIVARNRSTLLFANSRRTCEKITFKINLGEEQPLAYAHHGSLAREIRAEVEQKLKAGELKAIVATNSLELGIDIGALDEVVMIQAPFSVSSAIQRLGRAGHQVGEISRGTLFPTHSQDFLHSAVLAAGIVSQDIEAVKPIQCPLDVLSQVIVSMTGVEIWDIDSLYMWLKTSYPYKSLTRDQFDLVLNMLAGRYADSRIRELKPRLSIDRIDNTVAARKGALLALYMSGGTIPDRGYFNLRHRDSGSQIGDLDEEFVWEAKIGDVFTLGTQNWKIERITHNDVFVAQAAPKGMDTPFWKSEEFNRDFHFSEKISTFLEVANERLQDDDYQGFLQQENRMDETAARQLIEFLNNQKERTESDLPHRHHLLLEFIGSGPGGVPGNQLVMHTHWGGCVNRPLAMAMDAAWEERFGQKLEIFPGNDCIVFLLPHRVPVAEMLSLVTSTTFEPLLRKRLEGSGFFGARFRECAGRALLITRNKIYQRLPLWMSRLRSQKLMDKVMRYDDFPILLEAWRSCLQDEFDLENLRLMLCELESGAIKWSVAYTSRPSPFAQGMSWDQINKFMYMEDEPSRGKTSDLRGDLLQDVVFSPDLRPQVPPEIIEQFERKRQRLSPGYSPQASRDLVDWVMERLLIPFSEWNNLRQAIQNDLGEDPETIIDPVKEKLVMVTLPQADEPLVAALEAIHRILQILYPGVEGIGIVTLADADLGASVSAKKNNISSEEGDDLFISFLGEWLQYYGPKSPNFVRSTLGMEEGILHLALEDLVDSKRIISGRLVKDGDASDICDSENFEILLRMNRADAVPVFEPLDLEQLPAFLAQYQGLVNPGDDIDGLFQRIEQLICLPLPVETWEAEILPARLSRYQTGWIDSIMQEGDLRWIGSGKRRSAFCFEPDLDLMQGENDEDSKAATIAEKAKELDDLFPNTTGRYDFATLMQVSKSSSSTLADRLWNAVWQGMVTNDTFAALRRGIENRFKISAAGEPKSPARRRRGRSGQRGHFSAWKKSIPFAGNWFRLLVPDPADDLIELEERKKDRVRLLLDRYGILFREMLAKELPDFRWANVFRSLRLMELSGEVSAGYFFKDIPGPQFISHQAFRSLQAKFPEDKTYWINAIDPISLCGMRIPALKGTLPKRVVGTHLVYRGGQLAMTSERNGKSLTFHLPPDDARLQEVLCSLRHLLMREFRPLKQITIETINDEVAARSPYTDALRVSFEVLVEFKKVTLYRRIQ